MNINNRYWAAVVQIIVAVGGAFTLLPPTAFANTTATWTTVIGLATLGVQAIVTYFIPLANAKWAGAGKTIAALLLAFLGALLQFIVGQHFTATSVVLVVLAVLNVLLGEIGVQKRLDDPSLTQPKELRRKDVAPAA